ncbi:HEAT repeat domain-containing protein [Streptomyces sp. NPDC001595]|uniref:HEAT repeat domain-containing protein n=1 Tax=Streptomyces sp. NPDC001532 TaxID=3154520 RepID=UPI00331A5BA7
MAEHQIAYFLREVQGAADPARRAAAVKGLGRIGRPEHAAVLVRAAGDQDAAVRAAAAVGLGRLGVRGEAAEVLPALMGDRDPRVRRRASLAAIRLGLDGPGITDAFARLLSDPDRHVRINALTAFEALGVLGDVAAVAGLLGDPDPTVRGLSRGLLYRFADDPAVAAQVLRTARQGKGTARVQAMTMVPARCTESLLDSLLTGLRDPSALVRTAVADRLLTVESATVRDALAAALEDESDPRTAAVLLRGAGQRGDPRAARPALRWLADPVAGPDAVHALGSLGSLGSSVAAERLRLALDDGSLPAPTRAAAAVAVAEGGGWDAVWLLLPLLDDAAPVLRTGAVDALGVLVERGLRLWERHVVGWALTAHLRSGHDTWRTRNALYGLDQALPGVRRLADGASDGEVRAAALSLLDADGDTTHQDLRRFVRGLDDPYEAVRYEAATGLLAWVESTDGLAPEGALARERLARLASGDGSPRVRGAATDVLEALGAPLSG